MVDIDLSKYNMLLEQSYEKRLGKVAKVVGLTIESIGPAAVSYTHLTLPTT